MDAREWALWVAERSRDPSQALSDDIKAELMAEKATTLSRLGHRLDAARDTLARLRADTAMPWEARLEADRIAREELRQLRWEITVVKEAMGLNSVRAEVDRHWPMPPRLAPHG